MKRTALDPVWLDATAADGLVDLRLHATRLCFIADELRQRLNDDGWGAVAENLHLAASLRDLQADTDLTGSSYTCSAAADYDCAMSDLSARHLAGIIVFNFCWSAYEGSVELASNASQAHRPKGALGRDLLRDHHGDAHFPLLRQCLNASLEFIDPKHVMASREMAALLRNGMLAAVAAEAPRIFRNDVAHGTLRRPKPEDWGKLSEYKIDLDPAILRFHHHLRLLLVLTQIMMTHTDGALEEISGLTEDWHPATMVLAQLHLHGSDDDDENVEPELNLGCERIRFSRVP